MWIKWLVIILVSVLPYVTALIGAWLLPKMAWVVGIEITPIEGAVVAMLAYIMTDILKKDAKKDGIL